MLSTVVSYITDADNSTGILLVLLFAFIYVYGGDHRCMPQTGY